MKESSYNIINQFLLEAEAATSVISTPNIQEIVEMEASTDAIKKYQLTVDTYFNPKDWKMVPETQDIYKIDHGRLSMAYIQQVNMLGEIRYIQVVSGQALLGKNFTESDTGNLISGSLSIAYVEDPLTRSHYFELNDKVVHVVPSKKVNNSIDEGKIEKANQEKRLSTIHSRPIAFVPADQRKRKKRKHNNEINNTLDISLDDLNNIANVSTNAVANESDAYYLRLIDQANNNNNNNHSLVDSLWQRPVFNKYLLTVKTYFHSITNKLIPPGQEISVIRNNDSVLSFIESYDENNNLSYIRVRSGKAMREKEFIRPNGEPVSREYHKIVYVDDPSGPYFEWNGEKLRLTKAKLTYKPVDDVAMGENIIKDVVKTIISEVELLTSESFVRRRRSSKKMSA